MRILTISNSYPYGNSNNFVFVKQLMDKFSENGIEITVISPQSVTKQIFRKTIKRPYKVLIETKHSNYTLYSPSIISFSNIPVLKQIASYLNTKAILKTIKKQKIDFDLIYAHFLNGPGTSAYKIYKKYNKPYFIALGESSFNFPKSDLISKTLSNANGFIAVSNEIKERLKALDGNIPNNKIIVQSNGFDSELFYPINKQDIRKKLMIDDASFIVSFLGGFIERKGVLRLDQALDLINNPNIKAIFMGNGPENPNYKNIIYKGTVLHKDIYKYLNASDIFVLPTINEGSCNAIIEAIACGLPVISSNAEFNDDILDDSYSIRINSMSVEEIKDSILTLYNNPNLRNKMSKKTLEASSHFNLNKRTKNIIKFIEQKL